MCIQENLKKYKMLAVLNIKNFGTKDRQARFGNRSYMVREEGGVLRIMVCMFKR